MKASSQRTRKRTRRLQCARHGFTLVEIMIVVVIIGLLASMALPAISKLRMKVNITQTATDLRLIKYAAEQVVTERGQYPPDDYTLPATILAYLSPGFNANLTKMGGSWDWEYNNGYGIAAVSIINPTAQPDNFTSLDHIIDDGDLTIGRFRDYGDRRTFIIEDVGN